MRSSSLKVRWLIVLLIVQLFALDLIAQTSVQSVSTNSPADTLNNDSLKVVEDAPLDIGQNRGLFIVTPDGKMQLRILGSVRFLLVYDNIDLYSKSSFVTFEIPTGDQNKTFPNYYNDLNQTRLGFEITRKTELGNLFVLNGDSDLAPGLGVRSDHEHTGSLLWR